MNCSTVHEVLPLYLSGELNGEQMTDMQLHLNRCAPCTLAVALDREMDQALRAAVLEKTPDVTAVLERFREQVAAPPRRRMLARTPVRMAAAAAILVCALAGLPWFYVHQQQRNVALAAATDHYRDVLVPKPAQWASEPEEVTRFLQRQFPQKQSLLSSITPEGASFEKVRLCQLSGTTYAHFVFRMGAVETSVFLQANSSGTAPYKAVPLRNSEHGLDVAGFSSAGLTGIVVGRHGFVAAPEIAYRLSKTL
jgi:putative zinc finger protein